MKLAPSVLLAWLVACSSNAHKSSAPAANQDVKGRAPGGTSGRSSDAGRPGPGKVITDAPDAGPARDDAGAVGPEPATRTDAGPSTPTGPLLRDGGPSVCGDGVFDQENEECDPEGDLPLLCQDLGFSGGDLACTSDCQLDVTGCLGDEACSDGRDNDGDMLVDCDDEDCADDCSQACAFAVDLDTVSGEGDVLRIEGSTRGHTESLEASCLAESGAGAVVYRYVPRYNGLLEVSLESGALLTASVRTACDLPGSELGCELIGRVVTVPTRRDEPVFIVVEGRSATDSGPFALSLSERRASCGDGIREPSEQCDDGNDNDADGCTTECSLNPTETEPNDTEEQANDFENPFYGEIAPLTDVDVVRFEVPADAGVTLKVIDLGDDSCSRNTMDPRLRLFDETGELVAEDDDSGDGFCPELELLPLAPGNYTAEISRVSAGTDTFPYRLVINQLPAVP